MKRTSIFTLLFIALGFMANAQSARGTSDIPVIYDGMDSIVIHYNPYGSGGDAGDTDFQGYSNSLYAYCYLNVTGSGVSGGYNNGSWTSVVAPADAFTKVSDSNWVWVMPNVRQFFSVPKDVYVTGVNVIVKAAGTTTGTSLSDTQSANLFFAVSESDSPLISGQPITTGPITNVATGTFVPDTDENVVIYYHPHQDTFIHGGQTGDSLFATTDSTLFVWGWAVGSNGISYDITPGAAWTNVPTTPNDTMVEIDSNNYAWDIRNLRVDFMNAGLPAGVAIDSIGFIPRTSGFPTGSMNVQQTVNFYVPLIVAANAVANVNLNVAAASIYPNPATDAIFVNYAFAQPGSAKLIINNLMGQTLMTQDLGQNQKGNMYLSVNNLPSGVYLVTVTNGTSTSVQRMVKQ